MWVELNEILKEYSWSPKPSHIYSQRIKNVTLTNKAGQESKFYFSTIHFEEDGKGVHAH